MSITAKELAARLNLSESAVSLALNGKPGVSEKTRRLILEAATEAGYDFSRIREKGNEVPLPAKGTLYYIAYFKNSIIAGSPRYFEDLYTGAEEAARAAGYEFEFIRLTYYDSLEAVLEKIKKESCRGFIFEALEISQETVHLLKGTEIPFVLMHCTSDRADCNSVMINNYDSGYLAAHYLIGITRGRIGCLRSRFRLRNFDERYEGFMAALSDNGIPSDHIVTHELTATMKGAYEELLEMLKQGTMVADCYFAEDDQIAIGALRAFKEVGWRIPEEISLIGFDDIAACSYVTPSLATMAVRKKELGNVAMRRLISMISEDTITVMQIRVSTEFMKRGSVR